MPVVLGTRSSQLRARRARRHQLRAKILLELADVLADDGVIDAQLFRRPAMTAETRRGLEGLERN